MKAESINTDTAVKTERPKTSIVVSPKSIKSGTEESRLKITVTGEFNLQGVPSARVVSDETGDILFEGTVDDFDSENKRSIYVPLKLQAAAPGTYTVILTIDAEGQTVTIGTSKFTVGSADQ